LLQAAKSTDNKVMSFSELQELGRKKVAAPEPPKPSDLSTIMYTSGTTGALQEGSAVVVCSASQQPAAWPQDDCWQLLYCSKHHIVLQPYFSSSGSKNSACCRIKSSSMSGSITHYICGSRPQLVQPEPLLAATAAAVGVAPRLSTSSRAVLRPAGTPKGVMITHAALVATIAGCNQYLASFNESLGPEDSYLSFLPLAHVFDRCAS
jgi:non-ribosomal peptide synthetase component F